MDSKPSLKERIYYLTIDVIAFFRKVIVALSLPFKFLSFWKEEWEKNNASK